MSQDNVERILGRMITDSDFVAICQESLQKACADHGLLVTDLELSAIKQTNIKQFASLAPILDDRIKRACLNQRQR